MNYHHYIEHLKLQPHPEGGYYRETYRSPGEVPAPKGFNGHRNYATTIYYLLPQNEFSAFHRIKSDEGWHFYAGQTLLIHVLNENGYSCLRLGSDLAEGESFQHMVPAHSWFASEPAPATSYSLVGCTVAPGFDFRDFEMAEKEALQIQFPAYKSLIARLCR